MHDMNAKLSGLSSEALMTPVDLKISPDIDIDNVDDRHKVLFPAIAMQPHSLAHLAKSTTN